MTCNQSQISSVHREGVGKDWEAWLVDSSESQRSENIAILKVAWSYALALDVTGTGIGLYSDSPSSFPAPSSYSDGYIHGRKLRRVFTSFAICLSSNQTLSSPPRTVVWLE